MPEVALRQRRILVDGRPCLLLSGEIHYFRLAREDWSDRLDRLVESGCDPVATYIPWLWRTALERLGVRRRLTHDAEQPGLVVTSTVSPAGDRLLHLANVGPTLADFGLGWHGSPVWEDDGYGCWPGRG